MRIHAVALVLSLFAATNANAELITFDYTAKVTTAVRIPRNEGPMEALPSLSFNGTTVALGDTVHGSFTIDLDTRILVHPFGQGASSTYTRYGNPDDIVSKNLITMRVDRTGYSVTPTPGGRDVGLSIEDGTAGSNDTFMFTNTMRDMASGRFESIRLELSQSNGSLLNGVQLPSTLDLRNADTAYLTYTFGASSSSDGYTVNSNLTSLSRREVSPVPEPSTYAMLAVGLLTVGALVRRRKLS